MESYNFKAIEKKWQDKWEETGAFHAETNSKKPKYYTMIEFPYPSYGGLQRTLSDRLGRIRSSY